MTGVQRENKCPECLYMDLGYDEDLGYDDKTKKNDKTKNFKDIFSRPFKKSKKESKQVRLILTINFNEQSKSLPGGGVTFGLRGGELNLAIINGKIPYGQRARELSGNLELEILKQHKDQVGETGGATIAGKASTEASPSIEVGMNKESTYSSSDEFKYSDRQVTSKGSLENPTWVFKEKSGKGVLIGSLVNKDLAIVDLMNSDWKVKAMFQVSLKDVQLTGSEGIWLRGMSKKQKWALDIGLAKLFLKHQLRPYVSLVEISHV